MAAPNESSLPAGRRIYWAVAGLVLGFVASTIVGAAVLAAGDYDPSVPASLGTDIGRTAMQFASGVEFDDHRIPLSLIALLQVPLWIGLMGAPFMAAREGMSWRRDIRWSMRPIDIPLGLASGLALQLILVPVLYIPIFWVFGDQDVEEAARSLVGRASGPLDVVALVLVTVVGAPIIEEIFFRGLLFGALHDQQGRNLAVAVSAVVFAGTHLQILQFPALLMVGVAHALLVVRTGRLATAIWSHVGFNAVTVIVLLSA